MINKQQHKTTCGPVAVVNALRWMGYCNTYDEIVEFFKEHFGFEHNPPPRRSRGVSCCKLRRGLQKLRIKHRLIQKANLSDITRALDDGKAVILRFQWNRRFGHYVFIDKHTKNFVRAWNMLHSNKTPLVSKKKIRKHITYTNRLKANRGPAHVFIITPDAKS